MRRLWNACMCIASLTPILVDYRNHTEVSLPLSLFASMNDADHDSITLFLSELGVVFTVNCICTKDLTDESPRSTCMFMFVAQVDKVL